MSAGARHRSSRTFRRRRLLSQRSSGAARLLLLPRFVLLRRPLPSIISKLSSLIWTPSSRESTIRMWQQCQEASGTSLRNNRG
ncbi:hypothetical protein V6N13_104938 [Hibiscus sabdariffa]